MVDHYLVELMKPLREKPVEIDDQRVSFAGLIISRLDENALERNAVKAFPLHQLSAPPGELADLGINISDFLWRDESLIANPDNTGRYPSLPAQPPRR